MKGTGQVAGAILCVVLSALAGEMAAAAMHRAFLSSYDPAAGDGPLIWNAVLSELVCRPLIGATLAGILFFTGLRAAQALGAIPKGPTFRAVFYVILAGLVLSSSIGALVMLR